MQNPNRSNKDSDTTEDSNAKKSLQMDSDSSDVSKDYCDGSDENEESDPSSGSSQDSITEKLAKAILEAKRPSIVLAKKDWCCFSVARFVIEVRPSLEPSSRGAGSTTEYWALHTPPEQQQ